MTMSDVFAISQVTKGAWALVAFIMVFGLLRLSDYVIKLDFNKVVEGMENDPKAAALYLGLRVLGACILVGLLFS